MIGLWSKHDYRQHLTIQMIKLKGKSLTIKYILKIIVTIYYFYDLDAKNSLFEYLCLSSFTRITLKLLDRFELNLTK